MNIKELIKKLNEANDKFNRKLDTLSNKQLALIISSCLMGIFLLTLLNIQLSGQKDEEFLYELSFDEEAPLKEEIAQEKELTITELETHKAYNEAEKNEYTSDVDNFKTLEELKQEKQDATSEDPDNAKILNDNTPINEGYSSEYREKLQEQRRKIDAIKRKGKAPKVNIKRKTTITYSLIDRNTINLPNPVYTCRNFGKVVINIKVSPQGNVTDASFNRNSSTTQNECLVDNAINYALKAKFNSTNTSSEQRGTITYLFQGE